MVFSFASLLTAHVAIVIGLAGRAPRHRALVAVVLPPLGAVWAIRQKQWLRGVGWLVAALVYLVVRLLG
jgi:hypothetical protein